MATVATLLVAVALGATLSAFRLRGMSQTLEANLYFSNIALAHRELSADNLGHAQKLLDDCPPGLGSGNGTTSSGSAGSIRVPIPGQAEVNSVAFSPDGERLASREGMGPSRSGTAERARCSGPSTLRPTLSIPWRSTPMATTWPPRAHRGR